MTLVELLVYVVLLAIIGTLTTALILNVFRVNRDVVTTSVASNDAQVYFERIEFTIRNATTFEVRDLPDGSAVLVAQTRSTDSLNAEQQFCRAFLFDATNGELRFGQTDPTGAGPWASNASLGSWLSSTQPAISDVAKAEGTGVFERADGALLAHATVQGPGTKAPVEYEIETRPLKSGGSEGKCF